MTNKINPATVYTQARMTQLVELSAVKPMSLKSFADVLGVSMTTVRQYVKAMIKDERIYIGDWGISKGQRGRYFALYFAGNMPSVDAPSTENRKRARAYREKIKSGYVPTPRKNLDISPAVSIVNFKKQSWFSGLGMAA